MLKVSDTPNKDGLWSVHDEADQCVALVYDYGLAREMVEIFNDAQQSERLTVRCSHDEHDFSNGLECAKCGELRF